MGFGIKSSEKDSKTVVQLTATESQVVERQVIPGGIYRAKVKEVVEMEGGFDGKGFLLWVFEAHKGNKTAEVASPSSLNFGPTAKARGWYEAIAGRGLQTGENVDTADLADKWCQIVVEVEKRDDGTTRNKITNVVTADGDDEDAAF